MCFSASASFVAGTVLVVTGMTTLHMTRRRTMLPFAAIPLLFGIQQLVEGVIWLGIGEGHRWVPVTGLSLTYVLFSHVLWPAFVPVAVVALETEPWRRRALGVCAVVGSGVGLYLFLLLLRYPLLAEVQGGHIAYVSTHTFGLRVMALYLVATCVSSMLSSRRPVQLFGWLSLVTFIAAYIIHAATLSSVWCFFAAILSLMVIWIVREQRDPGSEPALVLFGRGW